MKCLHIHTLFKTIKTCLRSALVLSYGLLSLHVHAVMVEFNSTGGNTATDGLHFFIDETTQLQVDRLNGSGQVYEPSTIPPNNLLDNGIYLRANGLVYGPSHFAYAPSGGAFGSRTISAVTPANPAVIGEQQNSTHAFRVPSGPQVSIVWKYVLPYDFITAEVTLTIPSGYSVSSTNPVRYYHVVDTYLGGSDNGCGVRYVDSNGKQVVGTYPTSTGTCPSSTAVPAGISVVESFRERTGTFSSYCTAFYADFFDTSLFFPKACSITRNTALANTVNTADLDTGVAIQYAFTAAGTYTFSYDFVVGSTLVPAYDHLEIRHPGSATLCPTNVTVLACTSSTVPCPAANIVNTGTLTGSIRQSPGAPAITQTPSSFTLNSTSPTQTIKFQGTGAGTFTLTGQSLSSAPLNGTKCWNTSTNTASCSFTVTNTACVSSFECIETGVAYNNLTSTPSARNPLYTKLAGTGFRFDVVALQSSGAVASSYTASSGVTVELFDDSATPQPACSAYSSPVASQSITFASADAGRKTLASNITLNNAYRKLRCRVRDSSLNVVGCSSDNFSVRPTSFTVTSTNATAGGDFTNPSRDEYATPVFRAATDSFNLTASTNVAGYNGTPIIRTPTGYANEDVYSWAFGASPLPVDNYSAWSGYRVHGAMSGSFGAANSATGNAVGNFTYSEAGYIRFQANSIIDNIFTSIDQLNSDCTLDYSNSLVSGKYGCYVGHPDRTNFFGRFIPDHFTITPVTTTPGCSNSFTYYGQDGLTTAFTITAKNGAGATTQNYTDNAASEGEDYGHLDLSSAASFNFTASSGSIASTTMTSPGSWIRGEANVIAKHKITRPTSATAPANIAIFAAPIDSDGVTVESATAVSSASPFRYGRLWVPNTYGSELLPLTIPIEAQYWNGSAYVRNQQDACTVVPAGSIAMSNYRNNLTACETQLTGAGTMNAGKATATLSKPGAGNNGSVDLSINLNVAAGNTCNSTTQTSASNAAIPWFGNNPNARATFGIYKTPVIYMRENF